jgi:hypothetical protein
MIHKPLDQVCREDIEALVANEVKEGRTIEYKETLPGNADQDKKEFLADVSSFANAAGGDLLYGVVETREAGKTTGVPETAAGLAGINADEQIRRLDSMIQAGIGPRIAGVRIHPVAGFPDGPVLLVRVPKSYAAPHMVTFKEHSRFYSRNNGGKYALDVGEIRSAFALSEALPERVRRFRDERVARIVADETPVVLPPDHVRVVLHVVPVAALDPTARLDITHLIRAPQHCPRPLGSNGWHHRHNLDGFLTYQTFDKIDEGISYVQLFRSGAIEAVEGGTCPRPTPQSILFRFGHYEEVLIDGLNGYLKVLQELGSTPPAFVLLTVLGVKGYVLTTDRGDGWRCPHRIDRDALFLPDVLVDDFPQPADVILRPVFDSVWQAAGWARSPSYNEAGRWVRR